MKTTVVLAFLLTLVSARTVTLGASQKSRRGNHRALARREVPQEHSHEKFLTLTGAALDLDNPDEIADPVFGLLGNAAAIEGAGKITDADCLQQATADQAFTNAKAAGETDGMIAALVYRTLERNTGSVGLASVLCTSITAVNPEIAALSQHQDPASPNAAATNKDIALELAVQIASVGGDPDIALQSGTFAPGTIGDPTGAGNTCDTLDDPVGCIFTENLLVEDATADEIAAAVAAGSGAAAGKGAAAGNGTAVDSEAGAGAAAGNGAARDAAAEDEAARDAAAEDEAAKDEAAKDEAAKDEAAKDEAARDEAARDEAARDEAAKDEAAKDEAARDEAAGDAAAGDAAADVEEILSETKLDANTVLRLTKVTKAAADGAAADGAAADDSAADDSAANDDDDDDAADDDDDTAADTGKKSKGKKNNRE